MPSSTISIYPKLTDFNNIDRRLKKYLTDWKLVENYKGKIVEIPGDWDSKFYPTKYFSVIKEEGEPNYDPTEAENEIGLTLEGGWEGYDTEIIVNLLIIGIDVLDKVDKVSAEILKSGGAEMKLFHKDKLITNFKSKGWFPCSMDKIWIENLNDRLKNQFYDITNMSEPPDVQVKQSDTFKEIHVTGQVSNINYDGLKLTVLHDSLNLVDALSGTQIKAPLT